MFLVILAALAAVCGADKLDKVYLPPASAKTAAGSGFLQTPFSRSLEQGSSGLPSGGYTNEYQGVIVDAINPGTRASGVEQTGLGGPRSSYGSTASKVGEAAFRGSVTGSGNKGGIATRIAPGFESFLSNDDSESETTQEGGYAFKALGQFNNGNKYSSGNEGENVIALVDDEEDTGVQTQGVLDDGSYDAQKYNGGGDYSNNNNGNKYNDRRPSIEDKDATLSGSFIAQNDQRIPATPVGSLTQGSNKYSQGSQFGSKFGNSASSISTTGQAGQPSKTQEGYKPQIGLSSGTKYGQQSGFNSQVNTESRFGELPSKPASFGNQFSFNQGNKVQGSLAKAPYGTPGFSSAFSSAVTSGSGSASAFAQAGSNNPYPKQTFGSKFQGSDLDNNPSTPSIATASASVTDSPFVAQGQYNGLTQSQASANVVGGQSSSFASAQNGAQNSGPLDETSFGGSPQGPLSSVLPSSATASASVTPKLSTFEGQSQQTSGSFGTQYSSRPGQYSSTTIKPTYTQEQGKDNSYVYKQPNKPFVTPGRPQDTSSSQFGSSQQGSKYSNIPGSVSTSFATQTGQNYNGVTQAAASGFPSVSSSSSNIFGSKPSAVGQSSSQIGSTFGQSGGPTSTEVQEYEGTVYEYNKPAEVLPTPSSEQGKPSQISAGTAFGSQFSQVSSQSTGQLSKPTLTTFQQPQKPFGSSQTSSSLQQNQFGSSTGTNQAKKPTGQGTNFVNLGKPFGSQTFTSQQNKVTSQITELGSSSFSQGPAIQTSEFSPKPFGSSQTAGTGFQQTQLGSPTSLQFGQKPQTSKGSSFISNNQAIQSKPFGSSQTTSFQQSGTIGTQSGIKPQTTGSSYVISSVSQGQSSQLSPSDQKPFESSENSNTQQTQSISTTGTQFGQKPTSSQTTLTASGQKPFGNSQTTNSFQQTQFGSSLGSQSFQKPTYQGNSFISNTKPQGSQFAQKPFGTSQTLGSTFQQSQFGSTVGQKPQLTPGSTFSITTASPLTNDNSFVGSQSGDSALQQSQSGSSTGSAQKPSFGTQGVVSTFQESQISATGSQSNQTPETSFQQNEYGSSNQQSQFGISSSTLGQKPSSGSSFTIGTATQGQTIQTAQKPFGSSQTGSSFQQSQYGSSVTGSKGQTVQTTQFGSKPFGSSGSTFQQSQFSNSGSSYYGQKPNTGSSLTIGTATQKPFGSSQTGSSFQQNQYGTSFTGSKDQTVQTTQFGVKPFGSSGSTSQQSQFSTTGSTFGQKPTSGSSFTIGTATLKPFENSQIGSAFQQNQYGTSFTGSKDQSVQTTQFGSKPFGSSGSTSQQSQFSTTGSTFGQKPTSGSTFTIGTATQKPFGSSQTGSTFQQNQYGTSFTGSKDQTVQTTQFGVKPFGSSGFTSQQSQFSTTGSTFGQKPTSGSSFTIGTATQKPFGSSQTGSTFQQNQYGTSFTGSKDQSVQTTQFGSKPFGSSGSTSQQSQFSTTGSTFGQKPTSGSSFTIGTATQKPFASSQTGSTFQQNQYGTSFTGPKDQNVQTTQFGVKPFGSSGSTSQQSQFSTTGSTFGQKPTSGSSFSIATATQKPFGSSQTGSTFQQNQYGTSFTGPKDQTVQTTQFGVKPFGSSGFTSQQSQFSTTGSTFGQKPTSGSSFTIGTATQKPFGSSQTGSTFQQNQYGTSFTGSKDQTVQTTQFGSKPFGSLGFTSQHSQFSTTGSTFGQKPTSGSSFTIGSATQKPFGSSQTGSTLQQNQYGSSLTGSKGQTVQTTQFGTKPFGSSGSTFQQSQYGSGSTFVQKPQSTGSSFTIGTVSSDKKQVGGYQTGSNFQQNQYGSSVGTQAVKPVSGSQTTIGFGQKPFGSSQTNFQATSFGSSSNSQFNQKPQVSQSSSSAIVSKEETVQTTQFGQNIFESQTAGSGSQNQFGTSTVSPVTTVQYGVTPDTGFTSTGSQGQAVQSQFGQNSNQFGSNASQFPNKLSQGSVQSTSTVFTSQTPVSKPEFSVQSQKPFGSVQTTQGSGFQQTQFGSSGSYGQQPQINKIQTTGTVFGTQSQKPFGSAFQYGQKPQSSSSTAFASTTGTGSQFGVQPFGTSQFNKGNKFSIGNQVQKPFGGSQTQTVQQSQFSQTNQGQTSYGSLQKPFGSTLTQTSLTGTKQPLKPFGSIQGSSFQSQFSQSLDQKTQPTQASAFASTSQPEFGSQTSDGSEYVSTGQPQFTGFPVGSTTAQTSFQPNPTSPTIGVPAQGSYFGQSQASASGFGVQSAQSTAQTSQKFGQSFGTQGPTFQTLGSFGAKPVATATAQSSVGTGDQFGAPRDPPRFDEKTGYHY